MLARILFNIILLLSMIAGILAAVRYGIEYSPFAALGVFVIGMLCSFLIGVLKGVSESAVR